MLKHVRRGAALILSMAMFIQLGIGNNYITFANEESQTPEQTQEESGTNHTRNDWGSAGRIQ